jgi:Holliday junction resolvase
MTEAAFQAQVMTVLRLNGWLVAHVRDARAQDATGLPDVVAVHPQRGVLFAELKSATGRLRPDQERWIVALSRQAGVKVRVWRPDDLPEVIALAGGE